MISVANEAQPTIKFTIEVGGNTINFLDVAININNGKISTSLFRKETDRNNTLLASSFHPQSVIRAIPKSQFIRARRISSTEENYTNTLKERFQITGYNKLEIENSEKIAKGCKRDDLLKYKPKGENKKNKSTICKPIL
ncbi:hypothetical protein XELAEV_18028324mg [Xenopus laevis]|uniref:Helix-turn-helix domain-containing protein n=1 Tax=Xenopus laevis TaxID=8355 RepID=A0A974CX69_XENLA|nr:hypothetical protein XELAEV_18028324mg [Xenopus laevis]